MNAQAPTSPGLMPATGTSLSGAAAGITALIVYGAQALGHPLDPVAAASIAGAVVTLVGYVHPDGRK